MQDNSYLARPTDIDSKMLDILLKSKTSDIKNDIKNSIFKINSEEIKIMKQKIICK